MKVNVKAHQRGLSLNKLKTQIRIAHNVRSRDFEKLYYTKELYATDALPANSFSLLRLNRVFSSFSYAATRVCTFPFSFTVVLHSPISFQQIYPVLAVLVSLRPRLRDVKPSGSAGFSPFYLREEISRSSLAWRRDATERTFISCQAQQISQDEKSSRGNGTEFLLLAIYQWRYRNGRPGRIKVSTFGIDIERPLLFPAPTRPPPRS